MLKILILFFSGGNWKDLATVRNPSIARKVVLGLMRNRIPAQRYEAYQEEKHDKPSTR